MLPGRGWIRYEFARHRRCASITRLRWAIPAKTLGWAAGLEAWIERSGRNCLVLSTPGVLYGNARFSRLPFRATSGPLEFVSLCGVAPGHYPRSGGPTAQHHSCSLSICLSVSHSHFLEWKLELATFELSCPFLRPESLCGFVKLVSCRRIATSASNVVAIWRQSCSCSGQLCLSEWSQYRANNKNKKQKRSLSPGHGAPVFVSLTVSSLT